MSSFLYGGLRYHQIRHAVYCKLCKDTIESISDRDFKLCSCGSVGVDGGIAGGNRILGSPENMEQRSVYRAIVNGKHILLPASGLNLLDIVNQNAREVKG
jgi:hypothetical protein